VTPTAHGVGPFADPAFLEVVHRHHPRGRLVFDDVAAGAAVLEEVDGGFVGVGHRDLVDYRSPLGADGPHAVVELVGDRPLDLDSVPEDVARAIGEAFSRAGRVADVVVDDLTAVVDLPDDFDAWLAALGKKERHETRRKRRRYEDLVGPVVVEEYAGPGPWFDEFVALHRTSAGEKGHFMTETMAAFFRDLLALEGWSIRALVAPDGSMAAAGFGACDEAGFYLYNSAFDADRGAASPGVVLVAALIEDCIGRGLSRFDFLKGDEAYKFRLGARERPLGRVRVAT
jgi:CelD/BcsL family acetyltransferase involved in cellulose biosynthesis